MLLHNAPLFQIYFGDAQDHIKPVYDKGQTSQTILEHEPYKKLCKSMNITNLVFLHQVHGADGFAIHADNASSYNPFCVEGDYLITRTPHIGLGIMTADCLPIVCFDPRVTAVGIAHAGWRSSLAQIVLRMVAHMQDLYGSHSENLKFFFGPSAKSCCYKVSGDFASQLDAFPFAQNVMVVQDDGVYFNLPKFNICLLETIGVRAEAISMDYNLCTIDEKSFCSYRREKENSERQMTIVALR